MRMRHILVFGLPGSKTFSALSHKQQDFRENVIEYKMCGVIFSATFV